MPDGEAWQTFAGLVGVLVFLGAGAVALRRLGIVGSKPAAPAKPAADTAAPASASASDLADIKEGIADVKERLARVETKLQSRSVDHLWNEHRKVEAIANENRAALAKQEGVLEELRPLLRSLNEFLTRGKGGAE